MSTTKRMKTFGLSVATLMLTIPAPAVEGTPGRCSVQPTEASYTWDVSDEITNKLKLIEGESRHIKQQAEYPKTFARTPQFYSNSTHAHSQAPVEVTEYKFNFLNSQRRPRWPAPSGVPSVAGRAFHRRRRRYDWRI